MFLFCSCAINSTIRLTSCKFDGTGMVFRIACFRSCSCMKMLRWSFAYSAMVSNNSYLNWSSWFTTQNRLVSAVKDLVLRRFLNFLFLCSFFLFLIRCFSSLLELDEAESREKLQLVLQLVLSELLSKDIVSFSYVFVHLSYFLKDLHCHLHYLLSYFSPNLRKTHLQRFFQIPKLRPLYFWIMEEGGKA